MPSVLDLLSWGLWCLLVAGVLATLVSIGIVVGVTWGPGRRGRSDSWE